MMKWCSLPFPKLALAKWVLSMLVMYILYKRFSLIILLNYL